MLDNAIVFAVLKIVDNLVSMQKSFFADNCWSTQNYGKCSMWPYLFFIELLETSNSFVKIHIVLEIKNVNRFIKTRFDWKQGCTKML